MRVITDFLSAEDDIVYSTTRAVRDGLPFLLRRGNSVVLDDAEGHTAQGIVKSIRGDGLLELEVLWSTWIDDSDLAPISFSYLDSTVPVFSAPQLVS